MNQIKIFLLMIPLITLVSKVNSEVNNHKINEFEKKLEQSDKFLHQFITYFDKRIMWLEENFKGIHSNYSICCNEIESTYLKLFRLSTLVNNHLSINDEF